MAVLFAAGDPGGANAVAPVIGAVIRAGQVPLVIDHGPLARLTPIGAVALAPPPTAEAYGAFLQAHNITAYCFGTSLADTLALTLARAARANGIPVICVLDNWVNYRRRLCIDGLDPLIPDTYAVMDERALAEAIKDGVPETCLTVTGHPNLAGLADAARTADPTWRAQIRAEIGLGVAGRDLAVFVNEPVAKDQGTGPDHPGWRGYTERDALALLAHGLRASQTDVAIIAHPRDDAAQVAALWSEVALSVPGRVVTGLPGRRAILAADRVAGMASILLYESWMLGLPTLSLQPGLVRPDLLSIATRPGLMLVRDAEAADLTIRQWVLAQAMGTRPDIDRHAKSAQYICTIIMAGYIPPFV